MDRGTIFVRFNVAYGAPAPRERVQPEEGGTLQGWGTSACSHEGGTVAVARAPCLCPCVPRGVRPRTKPTEEGREPPCSGAGCRAWTQRLNEAQRALVRSRACALRLPSRRRARTAGEPAAALLPVERESGRATRKKLRQRRSAYAFARRFATSVGHHRTLLPV